MILEGYDHRLFELLKDPNGPCFQLAAMTGNKRQDAEKILRERQVSLVTRLRLQTITHHLAIDRPANWPGTETPSSYSPSSWPPHRPANRPPTGPPIGPTIGPLIGRPIGPLMGPLIRPFSVLIQCLHGKNDRFLGLFLEQNSVIAQTPDVDSPMFFCSCGITTTNLHYLISMCGWETLLFSKSRSFVLFQCLHGKNDRFLGLFLQQNSVIAQTPDVNSRNFFLQLWHNNNQFALLNFTVRMGDFVVFKKPLICPISVFSWQK